jgi:Na+/H+ antiporter NhaD/arsenite permease-like protein
MCVTVIVIYATRFCVGWAFLIARQARLKYERSEDFKASRAIRRAQFAQKRVAYKILLFETTSLKLPNFLKMISHLLLIVLTNFSRNVTLNVLSRARVGYLLFFALEQLGGSSQKRKMRIYDG